MPRFKAEIRIKEVKTRDHITGALLSQSSFVTVYGFILINILERSTSVQIGHLNSHFQDL